MAVTRDGTRLADTLRGTPGNDILRGHGSRDQLFGGAGNDLLSGGSASDQLFGEAGERHLVSGLCGRIWTLQRDYPALSGPDAFRAWDEAGTVRVLFAHWVERDGGGRAELISEARVAPVDRRAGIRLRALWTLIGRFEPLVGAEPLELAARRADGRARLSAGA